jgi:hypothetical protein
MDANLYGEPCGLKSADGNGRIAFDLAVPVNGLHARVAYTRRPTVAVEIHHGGQGPGMPFTNPLDTPGRLTAVFE